MELSVSIDQNQLKELLLQVGLVRPFLSGVHPESGSPRL